MKKRVSLRKDDIVVIAKALQTQLKTCKCNFTSLEACKDCIDFKEVLSKIAEIANMAVRKKLY